MFLFLHTFGFNMNKKYIFHTSFSAERLKTFCFFHFFTRI